MSLEVLVKPCVVCDSTCQPEIMRCRRCRKSFHKLCYPGNKQLCDRCFEIHQKNSLEQKKNEENKTELKQRMKIERQKDVICFICDQSDPPLFKKVDDNKWAHTICLLCSPAIKIDSFQTFNVCEIVQLPYYQCKICNIKSQHLIQCQLCDYRCHKSCINVEQDQQDRLQRYYMGNDLSKFQGSKVLLERVLNNSHSNLKSIFIDIEKNNTKKLMICEHHNYQQFCWCFCGNPKLNNEQINPSVICDGCEKYIHLCCSGLNTPQSQRKYYCPGCKENDIFKKNIQLPQLLQQAINLQKRQKLQQNDIRLLVALPFNYSQKMEQIISKNLEQIIEYYLKTQISHLLSSIKYVDLFKNSQFKYLIHYYAHNHHERTQQYDNVQEMFSKNIQVILSRNVQPTIDRNLRRFHKDYCNFLENKNNQQHTTQNNNTKFSIGRKKMSMNRDFLKLKNSTQNSPKSSITTSLTNEQIAIQKSIVDSMASLNNRDAITEAEVISVVENCRQIFAKKQACLMSQKLKSQIEKLGQYEEYQGSFYKLILVIPVSIEERQKLIRHFFQVKQYLKTKQLVPQQCALQLLNHSELATALGYKNRKYLIAVRSIFKRYIKQFKVSKIDKQLPSKYLSQIYKSYKIKQKGSEHNSKYPQSYKIIKLEDILYLDEDAVKIDLVLALQKMLYKMRDPTKTKVKKFCIKMRFIYHWVAIQADVPNKNLKFIKNALKEIILSKYLSKASENFSNNSKRFKQTIWTLQQLLRNNIQYNNNQIKKHFERICRLILKYNIQEQKTKDLSVISLLSLMQRHFNWAIVNKVQRKMNEIKQFFGQIMQLKQINKKLQKQATTLQIRNIIESKMPDYKQNSEFQCSRQIKRINIINQWCSISLKVNGQAYKNQIYTLYSLKNIYELMIETCYPKNNTIYRQVSQLYKNCEQIIQFHSKTLPKLKQHEKNPKTNLCNFEHPNQKIPITLFKQYLKKFLQIDRTYYKINVTYQIQELNNQILNWENLNKQLQVFVNSQKNKKIQKITNPRKMYDPKQIDKVISIYEKVDDLKSRVQACPIYIDRQIDYYYLTYRFNELQAQCKLRDTCKKKMDAYRDFWFINRQKITQTIAKKPSNPQIQWIRYIPQEPKFVRLLGTKLVGSSIMRFERLYEDNEKYMNELKQVRKKNSKENSIIDFSRLLFLKEALRLSIFDNGSTTHQQIEILIDSFQDFKNKLIKIIPYIHQNPTKALNYSQKPYLENGQLHKSLKKLPVRDLIVYLFQRDIRVYQYLRNETNNIAKQQSVLKPENKSSNDGYVNFTALAQSLNDNKSCISEKFKNLYQNICNITQYFLNAHRKKIGSLISKIYTKYLSDISENIDKFSLKQIKLGSQYIQKIYNKVCTGRFSQYIEEKQKEKIYMKMNETNMEIQIHLCTLDKVSI